MHRIVPYILQLKALGYMKHISKLPCPTGERWSETVASSSWSKHHNHFRHHPLDV